MEHEAKTAACCVVLVSVDVGGEEEEGKNSVMPVSGAPGLGMWTRQEEPASLSAGGVNGQRGRIQHRQDSGRTRRMK